MSWLLREAATLSTRTYSVPELNLKLDLSYITPQLIVCSGPVNSYRKSWYRYTTSSLRDFLNHKHVSNGQKHWRIWNFRGEGPGYSMKDFENRVAYFPFPDHQPPPFNIMIRIVASIDNYLGSDPRNVAVLHCKAGKGRSGTIACAYIMYKSIEERLLHPQEANDIFTSRRMNLHFGDGVSILSQRRYLNYWYSFLFQLQNTDNILVPLDQPPITIEKIMVKAARIPFDIKLETYRFKESGYEGVEGMVELFKYHVSPTKGTSHITINVPHLQVSSALDLRLTITEACYTWFCPHFETNRYFLEWTSFDGYLGTQFRGPQIFDMLEVNWRE